MSGELCDFDTIVSSSNIHFSSGANIVILAFVPSVIVPTPSLSSPKAFAGFKLIFSITSFQVRYPTSTSFYAHIPSNVSRPITPELASLNFKSFSLLSIGI